jgi:hypothetical protein
VKDSPPIEPFPRHAANGYHERMRQERMAKGVARDQGEASRIDPADLEDFYGVGSFPIAALPGPLRKIVGHYASKRGLPEHVIAAMALCVIGASVRHRIAARSMDKDVCRPNLHVLFAGPSGIGKTAVLNDLTAPIEKAHAERLAAYKRDRFADLKLRLVNAEKTVRSFETARAKSTVGENEYKDALKERDLVKREMRCSSGLHGNATEEGLFSEMALDYGWAFSKTDEASAQLSIVLGQYSGTTGGELYVNGYDSQMPVRRTRKGNEQGQEEMLPIMALLWCTQPDQVPRLGSNQRLMQGGFVPRLISLCYTGALGTFAGRNGAFDPAQEDTFAALVYELEQIYLDPELGVETLAKTLTLEREEGVEQFWKDHADRIKLEGQLQASAAFPFLLRIVEQSVKIAIILHLTEHALKFEVPHLHPISLDTAERALKLAEWYARSSADLYLRTEATGEIKKARKLVRMLRQAEGRFLAISEVTRHSALLAGDVQGIVDAWKEHNVFSLTKVDTGKAGKPPKRVALNVDDETLLKLGLAFLPRR